MPLDMNPVGKGYSLWLIPEEPVFGLLANSISQLSREYSTPLFDPHVTLLGGITLPEAEAVAKSASLAGVIEPFRIELGNAGYLDEYFRCLFIKVVPSSPIMKIHQAAREAFNWQGEPPYMPHLSLVYGKLGLESKERIAAGCSSLSGLAFEARHLCLYRVSGAPQEWKCVERFDLLKNSPRTSS